MAAHSSSRDDIIDNEVEESNENENNATNSRRISWASTSTPMVKSSIRQKRKLTAPTTQSRRDSGSHPTVPTVPKGSHAPVLHCCMDALNLVPENLIYESDEEAKKKNKMAAQFEVRPQLELDKNRPPLVIVYTTAPDPIDTFTDVLKEITRLRLEVLQKINQQIWSTESKDVAARERLSSNVDASLLDAGFHSLSLYIDEQEIALMKDRLSHFALRLVFADDPAAQEWFIQQECRLLQAKLWLVAKQHDMFPEKWIQALTPAMEACGISYEVIKRNPNSTDQNERRLWDNIHAAMSAAGLLGKNKGRTEVNNVIKMPFFPSAAPVVRQRKCFIKGGFGYVALEEMELVLMHHFRQILLDSFSMLKAKTSQVKDRISSNPVYGPLTRALYRQYQGVPSIRKSDSQLVEPITLQNIDKMCTRSFPPCMKLLFTKLKENHHLRYWGRLQLWLYLKGCGMTMDDQLYWWRSIWHDPEKFDKEIRYSIRHCYGQEGKQFDKGAWNCSKIIMGNPAPGHSEYHGCPFRHFDTDPLKRFLQAHYKIPLGTMNSITQLKDTHQYQLACQRLFQLVHAGSDGDGVGNQPTGYYAESCLYHKARSVQPKEGRQEEQQEGNNEKPAKEW